MNKEQFATQLKKIQESIQCARTEGLIEEEDHSLLESIQNEVESTLYNKSLNTLRHRLRREAENIETDVEAYFDAFAEDSESRNINIPFAGMAESVHDYHEGQPTEEEADELFGKFMLSALMAMTVLSEQAAASGLFQNAEDTQTTAEDEDAEDLTGLQDIPDTGDLTSDVVNG